MGWESVYAFTEQGVAMLSSVLRSKRAVEVNIEIMRAFVRLRRFVSTHSELAAQLTKLENRIRKHDDQIQVIFEAIRQLMTPPDSKTNLIVSGRRYVGAACQSPISASAVRTIRSLLVMPQAKPQDGSWRSSITSVQHHRALANLFPTR